MTEPVLRWSVYLAFCALLWWIDQRFIRRRAATSKVQTSAKPPDDEPGVVPRAWVRDENWTPRPIDERLLPPDGSWCGCCGRPCDEQGWWCLDCAGHVGTVGQPHDRSWAAMHGEMCPFTECTEDDDDDEDHGDIALEGLGVPGIVIRPIDRARERHHPLGHRTMNIAFLYDWEWQLWTDVIVEESKRGRPQ